MSLLVQLCLQNVFLCALNCREIIVIIIIILYSGLKLKRSFNCLTASTECPPGLGLCAGRGPWFFDPAEWMQGRCPQTVAHGHAGHPGGGEGSR